MFAFLAICIAPAALVGAIKWAIDRIYWEGYNAACADWSECTTNRQTSKCRSGDDCHV